MYSWEFQRGFSFAFNYFSTHLTPCLKAVKLSWKCSGGEWLYVFMADGLNNPEAHMMMLFWAL